MVNAEVVTHMRIQREKMLRLKNKKRAKDQTLDREVISNVESKFLSFFLTFFYFLEGGFAFS